MLIISMGLSRAVHLARMSDNIHSCRVLVGEPRGKRLRGGPSRRWDGNIKRILKAENKTAWAGLILFRVGTIGGLL
jgi:hypothetical protein